jgi:HlyD family secretion protein
VNRTAIAVGGVLALALAGTAAYVSRAFFGSDQPDAASTRIVTPEMRRIASTVLATGTVRLRVGAEVRVGSQVSGIVERLNVTVGSKIKRGDVIASIDARSLQARRGQAVAQVAVAEQEVRRAEVELARLQELNRQQLIARTSVEDAELALGEARARLEKARRDVAVVDTELVYTTIRTPISGTVASVSTQEGETVAASFTAPTFVTIIGEDALQLIAMVDETDIGDVRVGNPVEFTVEAFPGAEFSGRVASIAPKATLISGVVNYEAMIDIESPFGELRPDMTANVSIRTAERDALIVPSEAVQREGAERFVYVEENGKLTRRAVTVGTREGGVTEIRRGLSGNERVLVGALEAVDLQ